MPQSSSKSAGRPSNKRARINQRWERFVKNYTRQAIARNIETKTQLQVTDAQQVGSITGENKLIILCNDIFKTQQGTQDSILSGNANRVGDEIQALGFVLRYRLTNQCLYNTGGTPVTIPFVTYRLIVVVANAPNAVTGNPTKNDILDFQHPAYGILPCEVPLNKNGGFIKKVLLDKRITINNHGLMVNNNTANPTSLAGTSRDFKRYIKYPHKIRVTDSSPESGSPFNDTMYPIYVLLVADMGVNMGAPSPTSATIGWCTGYTQSYFKDA